MARFILLILIVFPLLILASEQSPYSGEERRDIKSLSDRDIQLLRSGAGMGLAKLAELNHYPGPRHVLELADELALSEEQRQATQSLYEKVKHDAIALGEKIIEAESELDQAFAGADVTAGTLESRLLEIGELRAQLRLVHLGAHLRQKDNLSVEQIRKYDRLRGYGGPHEHHHDH